MKIKNKILIALVTCTLLTVSVIGIFGYMVSQYAIESLYVDYIKSTSSGHVHTIDSHLQKLISDTRVLQTNAKIIDSISILDSNNKQSPAYLQVKNTLTDKLSLFQRINQLSDIFILNKNGVVLYANNQGFAWKYIGKELAVLPIAEWNHNNPEYVNISSFFENVLKGGVISFLISMPLLDKQNNIIGYIAIEPEMDVFFKLIFSANRETTEENILLSTSLKSKQNNALDIISPLKFDMADTHAEMQITDLPNKHAVSIVTDYQNKRVYAYITPIPKTTWSILTKINVSEVMSTPNHMRNIVFVVATVVSILVIFVALYLSKTLSLPISRLTYFAQRFRDDPSLSSTVTIDNDLLSTGDEIGILAQVFSDMINQLTEYSHSLKASKETAEKALRNLSLAQQELVRSEKFSSLGVLTAGIAHEMNNPLTFIASTITPLQNDIDEIMTLFDSVLINEQVKTSIDEVKIRGELDILFSELKQLLGSIQNGANRCVKIVKDLRMYSRLDEDALKKIDLHENINVTLDFMKNMYEGRIDIVKEYSDIPLIECYPGRINQVMSSILNNAFQAIEKSGQVTIKTELAAQDNTVTISVRDNGIGMDEKVLEHIFDPFFTTRQVGKGVGLGLSTCLKTIDAHHGKIHVTSTKGQGTKFIIVLPVLQPQNEININQ